MGGLFEGVSSNEALDSIKNIKATVVTEAGVLHIVHSHIVFDVFFVEGVEFAEEC